MIRKDGHKMTNQDRQRNVGNVLAEKEHVYHLQEYAVLESEEGTYEYVGWDAKREELSWIRGQATIVEDVFCLRNITSEGEEETMETPLEVKYELQQLPKWNKTKYYCVVIGEQQAALLKNCDNGKLVEQDAEEYTVVKKMLETCGVTLE